MEEHVTVESSFTAIINGPIEQIDIPAWCFSLPDDEYQCCSPAHYAAGATTVRDGRHMSINVEVLGGVPVSDLFTTSGRTKILVMWELKSIGAGRC